MIEFKTYQDEGIVEMKVAGKLERLDFESVGTVVDKMIKTKGRVKGLLVNVAEFHGWRDLDAALCHFRFVKEHHRYIERVAAVGDKPWQRILPKVAALFVRATPRYFEARNLDAAKKWIRAV